MLNFLLANQHGLTMLVNNQQHKPRNFLQIILGIDLLLLLLLLLLL